ncbi:MAG: flavin reductase family protein [Pirellulales bacterium]
MDFDIRSSATRTVYNLLIGLVAPRPIAWVVSRDAAGGLNAAPFSSYNYLCVDPPIIGFGVSLRPGEDVYKDTALNIAANGEFTVNVVTEDLLAAMNVTAIDFPAGMNELDAAGLATAPSKLIGTPRIAQAHAALECRHYQTLEPGRGRIILGEVVSVYVEDRFIDPQGPYIKAEELHAIGRMNGLGSYVRTRDAFLHESRISYKNWRGTHGSTDV